LNRCGAVRGGNRGEGNHTRLRHITNCSLGVCGRRQGLSLPIGRLAVEKRGCIGGEREEKAMEEENHS